MQNRLLNMLTIGGMSMLCFAPGIAKAEDGSSHWQEGATHPVFSNVNDAEAPAASVLSGTPSNPAPQKTVITQSADSPTPTQYRSLIESISRSNGVDPDLIDAVMKTESNYNRWAVSAKGARGLMQLIPETGRRFGVQDFFDPQQNIEGGVRYIRFLLDMFHGNVDLSLAAYNAGENLVARLGTIPPIPETRNYVRKIRAVFTKPSAGTFTPAAYYRPDFAPAPATPANVPIVSARSPEGIQEAPEAAISKWVDERGVHHISNIEPLN